MKVQGLIFACCIGLMFVLIMALTIDEKPLVEVIDAGIGETSMVAQGHGFVHPDFETMHRGGSGKERHDHILLLGWLFGTLITTLFVALLAFGTRRNDKVGPLRIPLTIGGVIYVLLWTAIIWSYRGYMNGDTESQFLLLPTPMAWMIYGFWMFPIFFIVLYVVSFKKHFWNDEIESEFNAIMEAKRRREEGAA